MKIGFVGLGNMGGPMALNLVKAGFDVTVFDLVQDNIDPLTKAGAIAASPSEFAASVDAVVSMLPAGAHVRELYLGENGLIHRLSPKTLVIDASTIDAQTARAVGEQLHQRDIAFIDAPVSGGVAGAAAGTLTFIVGGETAALAKAEPVLQAMGANIFHAGACGAGQIAKVCNNMLLSVLMAGTAEALQLGMSHGLDPKVLSDIMLKSSGSNWTLEKYNPCPGVMETSPASKAYQGGFMSKLMLKDLGLAMETAASSQSAIPMGSLARNLYALHCSNSDNLGKDFSSIFEIFDAS